jgi:hypothetical protein
MNFHGCIISPINSAAWAQLLAEHGEQRLAEAIAKVDAPARIDHVRDALAGRFQSPRFIPVVPKPVAVIRTIPAPSTPAPSKLVFNPAPKKRGRPRKTAPKPELMFDQKPEPKKVITAPRITPPTSGRETFRTVCESCLEPGPLRFHKATGAAICHKCFKNPDEEAIRRRWNQHLSCLGQRKAVTP